MRSSLPEVFFLVAGLLAGLAYLVLFPPLSIADEPQHLYRAAGLASGQVVAERHGGLTRVTIPASLVRLETELGVGESLPQQPERRLAPRDIRAAFAWPLEPHRRVHADPRGIGMYPFVSHLLPALGIAAGTMVETSPLALVYLGRLVNLLATSTLTWLAIRWAPFGKWPLALLALTPMAVSTRGSLSADAVTTALAFALVSLVARLAWASAPRERDYWLLLPVAAALCLTKLPYVALLLVLAAVPRERLALRRRWRFWLLFGAVVAASVGLTLWSGARLPGGLRPADGTATALQARALVADPSRFAVAMVRDYAAHTDRYVAQAVGVQLGWLDVQLPTSLVVGYVIVLLALMLAVNGPDPRQVTLWQRVVAAAAIAVVVVLVSASQYVIWTPYLADFVEGVQGRYLLPAAPLVVWLLAPPGRLQSPGRWLGWALGAGYTAVTLVACWHVAQRYWG